MKIKTQNRKTYYALWVDKDTHRAIKKGAVLAELTVGEFITSLLSKRI